MMMNKAEFFLMNNPLRAFIQEKYELPILRNMPTNNSCSSVLEIGCGNGYGTRLIKKYYSPEKIVATDLDETMIELARKDNDDNRIDFVVMDASRLEFPDNYFDAVFDFGIIHHIPNWQSSLPSCHGCDTARVRVVKNQILVGLYQVAPDEQC